MEAHSGKAIDYALLGATQNKADLLCNPDVRSTCLPVAPRCDLSSQRRTPLSFRNRPHYSDVGHEIILNYSTV